MQKAKKNKKNSKSSKNWQEKGGTLENLTDNEDDDKEQDMDEKADNSAGSGNHLNSGNKPEGTIDRTEASKEVVLGNNGVTLAVNGSFGVTQGVFGPVNLIDDDLPDMLIKVRDKTVQTERVHLTIHNPDECDQVKKINWGVFTSTWLSVSAKNIDIRKYLMPFKSSSSVAHDHSNQKERSAYDEKTTDHIDLDDDEPKTDWIDDGNSQDKNTSQPYCEEVPTSLLIPDHLEGVKMRRYLHMASESGLKEALQGKL